MQTLHTPLTHSLFEAQTVPSRFEVGGQFSTLRIGEAGNTNAGIGGHVAYDFSRWLADVFRDHPLAGHVRDLERRAATDDAKVLAADIARSIRARYETAAEFDAELGRS